MLYTLEEMLFSWCDGIKEMKKIRKDLKKIKHHLWRRMGVKAIFFSKKKIYFAWEDYMNCQAMHTFKTEDIWKMFVKECVENDLLFDVR